MLNVERLRMLVAVDQHGSITAAAKALHMTPSAISQQLKILSTEAKATIVEALPTGVRCTPAGKLLVSHAIRILDELKQAEHSLAELNGQEIEEVRFACFPAATDSLVPEILRLIAKQHPTAALSFDVMRSPVALRALCDGAVDAALVARYPGDPAPGRDLRMVDLGNDLLVAAMPTEHPLTQGQSVQLSHLTDIPLLLESSGSPFCQLFLAACADAGITPQIRAWSPQANVALDMVAQGVGIALLPAMTIDSIPAGITAAPLSPAIKRTVTLAFRASTERSRVIDALVSSSRQAARTKLGYKGY
ncbi:LysR family transcriptional regulator [Mycolicibacterium mageritense]|uniref:LysR family transcriptional regulator n=1 Tax=Mycolicibacterium mageritense TaxID=53462 RepID=UPI001E3AD0DE|nr:LysR family transcriptional regulator [Mycolicibacterium mageritense]GJJ23875.1 LysR family transcriptional regulator [Mycolicibacterium mageritense]